MLSLLKSVANQLKHISFLLDIALWPISAIALVSFRLLKYIGLKEYPLHKKLFYRLGVIPVVDHYYEPLFNPKQLSKPLHTDRSLPGIDFKINSQLDLIRKFSYQNELKKFPNKKPGKNNLQFYYENGSFPSGDAELYYSIIRHFKPNKIIEIGSGFSTLIALEAIKKNDNNCKISCIEPFEFSWLEELDIEVFRNRVELVPPQFFDQLAENDILFIDSSHIIRPQGDVLWEILELLPRLNNGMLIHFHDIFTPHDYPLEWLTEELRLWNEQYLLEAFLSFNNSFEIVISMQHLTLRHRSKVIQAFPVLASDKERKPGSFWIRKIK